MVASELIDMLKANPDAYLVIRDVRMVESKELSVLGVEVETVPSEVAENVWVQQIVIEVVD